VEKPFVLSKAVHSPVLPICQRFCGSQNLFAIAPTLR